MSSMEDRDEQTYLDGLKEQDELKAQERQARTEEATASAINYPFKPDGTCAWGFTLESYAKYPDRYSDHYVRDVRTITQMLIGRGQELAADLTLKRILRDVSDDLSPADNAELITVALDALAAAQKILHDLDRVYYHA